METLDEQRKGSFGCTTSVEFGCMVVGVSCLKEGRGVGEKHLTYLTKPNGGRFVLRTFSIHVLLLGRWEFPSYSFGLVVRG
jgi:hypothetical protein